MPAQEEGQKRPGNENGAIEIPASLVAPVLSGWNDSTRKLAQAGDPRILERHKTLIPMNERSETSETSNEKETTTEKKPASKLAFRVDNFIPRDPEELQQTALFQSAMKLVQHQRDHYLVGKEYADWQREHRDRPQPRVTFWSPAFSSVVYDSKALGHGHVSHLGKDFIVSPTMMNAALPLVTSLPTTALYEPAQQALLDQIQGRQDQLNEIVRSSILNFLQNPENRVQVKTSANSAMMRNSMPEPAD